MRKRWRGWKCCSQTFHDYNLYNDHIDSVHLKMDASSTTTSGTKSEKQTDNEQVPSTSKEKAIMKSDKSTHKKTLLSTSKSIAVARSDKPTRKKTQSSTSKPMTIMCPLCLTNHESLGPDIKTKPCWNESDSLQCPLCERWYKTLRQLKIHFCEHFEVKVTESEQLSCRYCNKDFALITSRREHEAICVTAHAAKQNCKGEGQQTRTQPEVVASKAASQTAATPVTAVARVSMVASLELASSTTALSATAAEPNAAVAGSAAETPSAAMAATSKLRDERLFFCPDCGKLFTWAGSVRRHQQNIHAKPIEGNSQGPSRRKRVRRHQPENHSQNQPQQLNHGSWHCLTPANSHGEGSLAD